MWEAIENDKNGTQNKMGVANKKCSNTDGATLVVSSASNHEYLIKFTEKDPLNPDKDTYKKLRVMGMTDTKKEEDKDKQTKLVRDSQVRRLEVSGELTFGKSKLGARVDHCFVDFSILYCAIVSTQTRPIH